MKIKKLDRKLWPTTPDQPGSFGIVTAADEPYALHLETLIKSIRKHHRTPIEVYDLGLSEPTKSKLLSYDLVDIVPVDVEPLKAIGECWQAWWKPLYVKHSKFEHLIWIDADCVVLAPIGELFAYLTDMPFFTPELLYPENADNHRALYEALEINKDGEFTVNSGVFGFKKGRPADDLLIEKWIEYVNAAKDNESIRSLVKWWDQGALLLAMHQTGSSHYILYEGGWNVPAKRHLYEPGEGMLSDIETDNPGVKIAHFSEIKLHHLVARNDQKVCDFLTSAVLVRSGTVRAFCVGLERAGTHTITRALRASCKGLGWIRHEHKPVLAREAYESFSRRNHDGSNDFSSDTLAERIRLWRRIDSSVVFEANHRLSFFIKQIERGLNGDCKFILLLRDPIKLIKSRIKATSYWPDKLPTYPVFYQQHLLDNRYDRTEQSDHRIIPTDFEDLNYLDLHVWEIKQTLQIVQNDLNEWVPDDRVMVLDTSELPSRIEEVINFIDPTLFDVSVAKHIASTKWDTTDGCPDDLNAWANTIVDGVWQQSVNAIEPLMRQICVRYGGMDIGHKLLI